MIAALIVTWNSAEVIGPCLDSCLLAGISEIIVVDNASEDGTVAEVRRRPSVRLLANSSNLGFAGGVNQGTAAADSPLILLLNPDTQLIGGLDELAAALRRRDAGAAAGCLEDGTGVVQHGFNVRGLPSAWTLAFETLGLNRIWPTSAVNRRYRVRLRGQDTVPVEQPAGAFLAFRRDVWQELGGFDESFWPAWFEDVDFCKRLRDRGWTIWYVPAAMARHQGGHSVRKLQWSDREFFWYSNLLTYAAKHFTLADQRLTYGSVVVGCILRACGALFRRFSLEPVVVYSRVVWIAFLGWFGRRPVITVSRQRNSTLKGLRDSQLS